MAIAAKLGDTVSEADLIALNKPMYARLSPGSKLQEGTKLLLPGDVCGWNYAAELDDTIATVAAKLQIADPENFLAINVGMYGPDLSSATVLPEGTKLLVPAGADSHFLSKLTPAAASSASKVAICIEIDGFLHL